MSKEALMREVEQTLHLAERGLRAKAADGLRSIFRVTVSNSRLLWDELSVGRLAKAFVTMYLFDIFEREEDNILAAQYALLFSMRAEELHAKAGTDAFEAMKDQVIVLKLSQDCFVDLVSLFYQNHKTVVNEDMLRGSRMLAQRVLPYVLYHVLIQVTDMYDGFRGDQYLEDTCNELELEFPLISEKLMKEAANIKRLMYLQLQASV